MHDVEDTIYWKAMFALLRAVFSALYLLRLCDKNTPVMDMIYFLVYRTSCAIEKSVDILNDEKLFSTAGNDGQDLAEEVSEVFGDEEDANEEDAKVVDPE